MSIEAGWYPAEGDPPGTVRRWNGHEWIGFPIAQPTAEGTTPGNIVGVKRFQPVAGHVSLQGLAIGVQLTLIVVAIASIFQAVSLYQVSPYVSDLTNEADLLDDVPDALATRFEVSQLAVTVTTAICALLFVTWFFLAYRNVSRWQQTRRSLPWAIFAWIVPFINLVRPLTMMLEIAEKSPRPDQKNELNPTAVIAWWVLWMFAQFGLFFFVLGSDLEDLAQNVLVGQSVVVALSVVAAGFAIYIVQGVTDAQESRRHPSPAQRELMQQDAETAEFQKNKSTGIVDG